MYQTLVLLHKEISYLQLHGMSENERQEQIQMSQHMGADSPEPLLLTYTKYDLDEDLIITCV